MGELARWTGDNASAKTTQNLVKHKTQRCFHDPTGELFVDHLGVDITDVTGASYLSSKHGLEHAIRGET